MEGDKKISELPGSDTDPVRIEGPKFEGTGVGFYRCVLCHSVVSPWDIKVGGCPHCAGTRLVPTNLRWWEKIIQIIKHPAIWRWPNA